MAETTNNNFCKLFQIDDNHQVLYQLVIVNDDNGEPETAIQMKTFIDGLELKTTASGFTSTTAEAQLETITIENAQAFFNKMNNIINQE